MVSYQATWCLALLLQPSPDVCTDCQCQPEIRTVAAAKPAMPTLLGDEPSILLAQVKDSGGLNELPMEHEKLGVIDQAMDTVSHALSVTTSDPSIKIQIGGAIIADFLYTSRRPVAPGIPFFLTPGPLPGFRQQTFDATARQSMLTAFIEGPDVCGFKSSAVFAANFYNSSVVEDLWGFLPILAYAQLKNDDWRIAAGLQYDIFNPLNPTVLPFSYLGASGNTGAWRSQLRVERYFHPSEDSDLTLIGGISDPVPTTVSNTFRLNEDNGWPNIEARVAWATGPTNCDGVPGRRPFEVGVSGLVGQMRTTIPFVSQTVANTWGLGADLRWAINSRFGIQGELFTGESLGTYMGGILQNVNRDNFLGIRSSGGWIEVYYYLCPDCVHTHIGYGIDDPRDADVAIGQAIRNETYFANLLWDVTRHFRLGAEFTYRRTEYKGLPNNEGFGIQTQVQLKF
jgi:hypothetical protein